MEGERKEEGLCARPFFDISVIYDKYLAHILGSATEIIIKIIFVDDFVTVNILIKSQFNNRNTIYQNKVYGKVFSLALYRP